VNAAFAPSKASDKHPNGGFGRSKALCEHPKPPNKGVNTAFTR
jgi:hypothetical protein